MFWEEKADEKGTSILLQIQSIFCTWEKDSNSWIFLCVSFEFWQKNTRLRVLKKYVSKIFFLNIWFLAFEKEIQISRMNFWYFMKTMCLKFGFPTKIWKFRVFFDYVMKNVSKILIPPPKKKRKIVSILWCFMKILSEMWIFNKKNIKILIPKKNYYYDLAKIFNICQSIFLQCPVLWKIVSKMWVINQKKKKHKIFTFQEKFQNFEYFLAFIEDPYLKLRFSAKNN